MSAKKSQIHAGYDELFHKFVVAELLWGKRYFLLARAANCFLLVHFQVETLTTLVPHAFTLLRSVCVFKKEKIYRFKEYEG